jgi:hypothetical protein
VSPKFAPSKYRRKMAICFALECFEDKFCNFGDTKSNLSRQNCIRTSFMVFIIVIITAVIK